MIFYFISVAYFVNYSSLDGHLACYKQSNDERVSKIVDYIYIVRYTVLGIYTQQQDSWIL